MADMSKDKIIDILAKQIDRSHLQSMTSFKKNRPLEFDNIDDSSKYDRIEKEIFQKYQENYGEMKPSNRLSPRGEISTGDLYQLLLTAMQSEHEKTRTVVKEETCKIKQDIIACIKTNPIATIELLSKLILICASFSLAVWIIIDFSIINPLFSLFLIFSSLAGIGMSKIRKAKLNNRE